MYNGHMLDQMISSSVPPTRCIFSHLNQSENFTESEEANALIDVEVRTGVLWMLSLIKSCADWMSASVGIGIMRTRIGAGGAQ